MQRLLKAREMLVEPVRSLSGSKSNSMAIAPVMPPTFTSPYTAPVFPQPATLPSVAEPSCSETSVNTSPIAGLAAALMASTSMSMTTENWSFTFLRSLTSTVAELPTSVFRAVSASEMFRMLPQSESTRWLYSLPRPWNWTSGRPLR